MANGRMTGDTAKMREASGQVANEKRDYSKSVEELGVLITNTLEKYWSDEAYRSLKDKYITKHSKDLAELGQLLQEFSTNLDNAADDLDATIKGLM